MRYFNTHTGILYILFHILVLTAAISGAPFLKIEIHDFKNNEVGVVSYRLCKHVHYFRKAHCLKYILVIGKS